MKLDMTNAELFVNYVAPPAGAWIETIKEAGVYTDLKASRPLRARGLKPDSMGEINKENYVAPPAGAWIETAYRRAEYRLSASRAPCGRVD